MLKHLSTLALASLVIAPAAAQDKPAEAAKPEKSKKICRTAANTGSRMAKRECRTQAEWDAADAQVSARPDLLQQGTRMY